MIPKISKNSTKSPKSTKSVGQSPSPPQELEKSLHSKLYVLVYI